MKSIPEQDPNNLDPHEKETTRHNTNLDLIA